MDVSYNQQLNTQGESQLSLACSNCGRIFDLLNNTPYKLPCNHTACKSCLRNCHKEKKDFKCSIDGVSVTLHELRTLQKNAEVIQKIREKLTDRQSPAQSTQSQNTQMLKFTQDQVNPKKDSNEDYNHMNSLLSNNLSTHTPFTNDGKELATLSKLEFKKPDLQNYVVEEEKSPHESEIKSASHQRSSDPKGNQHGSSQQNVVNYPPSKVSEHLAPNGRLEEVLEEESYKDKTTESMIRNSYQNDASQSIIHLTTTHNDNYQQSDNQKGHAENKDQVFTKGLPASDRGTPLFQATRQHSNQDETIEPRGTNEDVSNYQGEGQEERSGSFNQERNVKPGLHDPHHGRHLSHDSQHHKNAQEYVEQLITKSVQISQRDEKQKTSQESQKQEQEDIDISAYEQSEKGKKSKKKGKKKKKKKSNNANQSYMGDESYYVDTPSAGLEMISEMHSQKSQKSIHRQPSQGNISELKSAGAYKDFAQERNSELMDYLEDLWARYDADQDGYLVLEETAVLYADLVMSHGTEMGLEEENHNNWFHQIDQDYDGRIAKEEMLEYLMSINYMVKAQVNGFTHDQLQQYLNFVWFRFDTDNDGYLDLPETRHFYEEMVNNRPDLGLKSENHRAWFNMIDADGDGTVSKDEMFQYFKSIAYHGSSEETDTHVMKKKSPEMAELLTYIEEIWRLHDTDKDGFLTFLESRGLFADLVRSKPELGFSFEKHKEWFEKIDIDGDGAITHNEMLMYLLSVTDLTNPFDTGNHGLMNVSDVEAYVNYLWFKYDTDRDDHLVLSEMKLIFEDLQNNRPDIDLKVDNHIDWFAMIDTDNAGQISKAKMTEFLLRIQSPTEEEDKRSHLIAFVEDLIGMYDSDKDGCLNFRETYQIFDDLYANRDSLGIGNISHGAWFRSIDKEYRGVITSEQLVEYLEKIDYLAKINSHRQINTMKMGIQNFVDYLWDVYDVDKDGFITIEESEGFFAEIINNRPDLGFTSGMLKQWFNSIDVDGDKVITKHEMLHYFISINYNGQNDSQKSIEQFVDDLWGKYDKDGDGYLTLEETKPFFETLVMSRSDLGLTYGLHEQWFHSIDIDDDGVITRDEMLAYFISINYSGYLNMENLKAYVDYLWSQYDQDNDGYLVLSECQPFFNEMMKHRPDLQLKNQDISTWYKSIDVDGDGVITKPEMLQYFISINYSGRQVFNISDYVTKLWEMYDTDKDGYLTLEETQPFFIDLIKHRSDLGMESNMHGLWFRSIDVDDDGTITKNEMLNYFMFINYAGQLNRINLQAYIDFIYNEYDQDKDGHLSKEESKVLFEELIKHRPDLRMKSVNHGMWFKRIDRDGDGNISKKEMIDYFTLINYSGKPVQHVLEYVNEIFAKYDLDQDGFLTVEETAGFYQDLVRQRSDLGLSIDCNEAWVISLDADGDGVVSKQEMLSYFISINYSGTHNENNLQAYVEYLWSLYDTDNDGLLTIGETKLFYIDLIRHRPDLGLHPDNLEQWFNQIDIDQDGVITRHEMNSYFQSIHYSGKPIQMLKNLVEELYFKYDKDRDGQLTQMEILPFFQDLVKFRSDLALTLDKHEQWFQAIDQDNDEHILKHELLNYLASINYTGAHDRENAQAYVDYLWVQFDEDNDGFLTVEETYPLYEELSQFRPDLELTPEKIHTWFRSIDSDDDGGISKAEMMNYFNSINYSGRALLHVKNYVDEIWQKYDVDRDGHLTTEETMPFYLDLIIHRKDLNLSSDRQSEWFHQIDLDNDGYITKLEMFHYFANIGYSGKQYELDHLSIMKIRLHVDLLWARYDQDQDGYLQIDETKVLFEELIQNRTDLNFKPSEHQIWFATLDQDGDKRISRFEMYEYFSQLNYNGQKAAPPKVIPVFDINNVEKYVDEVWNYYERDHKDGQISFEEGFLVFKDLLQHKPDFGFKEGQEKQWFSVVDTDGDAQINRLELMTYLNNLRTIAAKKPFMNFVKDKVMAVNAFKHASSDSIHKSILTPKQEDPLPKAQVQLKSNETSQANFIAKQSEPVASQQTIKMSQKNSQEQFNQTLSRNQSEKGIIDGFNQKNKSHSIQERKSPSPAPSADLMNKSIPSNSITKSMDSHNVRKSQHSKAGDKNVKQLKIVSQEQFSSPPQQFVVQQSPTVPISTRKDLIQNKEPSEKSVVINRSIHTPTQPASVKSSHQQEAKSVGRVNPVVLKNPASNNPPQQMFQQQQKQQQQKNIQSSKQNAISLPEIKPINQIISANKIQDSTQHPKSSSATPKIAKKQPSPAPIVSQNKNSQSQKYTLQMNQMKDYMNQVPAKPVQGKQLQKLEDYKREEESDILLSSKKSDIGRISYGEANRVQNNFMIMSEKSYNNEEIGYIQTDMRDQEYDHLNERTIDSQLQMHTPNGAKSSNNMDTKGGFPSQSKSRLSSNQSIRGASALLENHINNGYNQGLDDSTAQPKMPTQVQPLSDKCKLHPRESIKYFCRDPGCLKGLCPECIIEHSKHDFLAANELASFEIKQLVRQAQRKCKNQVKIQKDIKQLTEKKLSQLNRIRTEEFQKLHTYFGEIKKALDEREQQLNTLFNSEIKETESSLMKDLHNIQQQYTDSSKLFKLLKVFSDQQAVSSEAGVVASSETAYQLCRKANQRDSQSQNLPFYVTQQDASAELHMPSFELNYIQEKEKIMKIGHLIAQLSLEDKLEKSLNSQYFPSKPGHASPSKSEKIQETRSFVEHFRNSPTILSQEIQTQNLKKVPVMDAQTQTAVDLTSKIQKRLTEQLTNKSSMLHHQQTFSRKASPTRNQETPAFNEVPTSSTSKNIHWFKWDTSEVYKYELDTKQWIQKKDIKTASKFLFFSSIVHLPNEQGCFILGGADNENNYSKRVQYFCKYNVFVEKPPMISKRAFFPSLFAKLDNSIYALGGSDSNSSDLNKCEKFSLVENVWRPIAPMNLNRNGTAAVLFEQYRLIFTFGGNNHKHGSIKKIEKYEIDFDKWSIITTQMKASIHDLTVFPVGGERVLILGGHTNTEPNKDIHLVDLSFECLKSRSGKTMMIKEGGKTYFPPAFDQATGKISLIFGYCDIQPTIEEIDVAELLIGPSNQFNMEDQEIIKDRPERRSQSLSRDANFVSEF